MGAKKDFRPQQKNMLETKDFMTLQFVTQGQEKLQSFNDRVSFVCQGMKTSFAKEKCTYVNATAAHSQKIVFA